MPDNPSLSPLIPFCRLSMLISATMLKMCAQSSQPSDILCLESVSWLCWIRVLQILSSLLSVCNICVCILVYPDVYGWSSQSCPTDFASMKMFSWHPVSFSSALRGNALLLLMYCICASCYTLLACQFSSLWWCRSAICLFCYTMCLWSTILVLNSYCRPYRERKWGFVTAIIPRPS